MPGQSNGANGTNGAGKGSRGRYTDDNDERERLLAQGDAERGELPRYRTKRRDAGAAERAQRRRLMCTVFPLLGVATLLILMFSGAIPNPIGPTPHTNQPGTSDPKKDSPHVVIPTNRTYTLPPPTDLPRNQAYMTEASHGAVASEDITCSNMGVDVLREGGNAVDAAITTCLCIGVLNSFSSGIGGGGFMLVRAPPKSDADGWSSKYSPGRLSEVTAIDFRETGPAAAHEDMYVKVPTASQVGGLSVGTPGELAGLWRAYEMYGSGKLSWERLVRPNVDLARGWRVSRELARRFRVFGSFMEGKPEWEEVFRPRGAMLVEGDWVKRPAYADTLQWIGQRGVNGFYGTEEIEKDNWIAQAMVDTVKREGGIMTREDLAGYALRVYPAISSTYQGKTVYTTDAPSSGPVMLGMLNALEHYNLSDATTEKHSKSTRTGLNVHRITEALKFAFGARTEISDTASAFVDGKRKDRIEAFWRDREWGDEVWANITDDTTHTADYYNPVFDVPYDSGTTHLSVVDRWGGSVSLTSTVNLIFGSRVMDAKTGIIMNDEMDDFSQKGVKNAFGLAPSPFNYPGPLKRPLSSTAATIVEHPSGALYASLGGSGGSRIFGAVAQVLLNLEWGMNISAAIEEPRLHDQLFPAMVTLETAFEPEFVEALKDRGHNVTMFDINLGVAEVQAVVVDERGRITAASDSRKNGIAAGY